MKHQRWSIYRANLDPVVGTEINKSRHVLIISNDVVNELLQNLTILPISSRKQGRTIYPNEALLKRDESGLEVESIV